MRFTDRVLFATGAGSGIAAAAARQFSAERGRVAVVDIDSERAADMAASLDGAIGICCDVSSEESVNRAVAETRKRLGRIDAVLNAAGHADFGPIDDYSLERWNRMIAVHATGTFLVCKAAVPALRAQGGGSIVNVSSIAAHVGRMNLVAYTAAKGAILSMSRQLALELAGDRIRVNVVAPGVVRTGLTEAAYVERGGGDFDKGAAQIVADTPQKRVAAPEEIAAPICFLLSDEASFCTGSVITPDGGMTAI
ncbi:MAG: SDR family oxidoreductase [Rhodospirillaceae bacterium]|nr:SDR family oxidoreductase [Rhodospirillaceae bacterium]MYF87392.1 SDR family oxidoreductase [Rhodospirillaceae bacterium]MYH36277.1 SDR family oxidoreductase [Rhodospirillaceae bacterium]MYK15229.1 SDR family oxidoreductase [Rhodospirillaceae bacterium]MYK58104.1 SDR family oxidoreductase [Rhodospirillaceae bacterium]